MGVRAVEGTGLENRRTGDRIVGSNPTPSATLAFSNFRQHTRSEVELLLSHEALA